MGYKAPSSPPVHVGSKAAILVLLLELSQQICFMLPVLALDGLVLWLLLPYHWNIILNALFFTVISLKTKGEFLPCRQTTFLAKLPVAWLHPAIL